MRTQFKFETAEQTMDFVRLTRCDNYDLVLCIALVDVETAEDYRYAAWCAEAACQGVFK